jgi:hypothetical protein
MGNEILLAVRKIFAEWANLDLWQEPDSATG